MIGSKESFTEPKNLTSVVRDALNKAKEFTCSKEKIGKSKADAAAEATTSNKAESNTTDAKSEGAETTGKENITSSEEKPTSSTDNTTKQDIKKRDKV